MNGHAAGGAQHPSAAPRRATRPRNPFRRFAWITLVAVLLGASASVTPATAPGVAAAGDSLNVTTAATYTVVPASRLVRVAVDVTARNDKPNLTSGGVVTRYFYDSVRIGIQPEARNIRATAGSAHLPVATTSHEGSITVEVPFRSSLFYRQTATVRVTYDLPAGEPRSDSEVRVGPAFATFVAWSFGDAGSVTVTVPPGFDAATSGAKVTSTTTAAGTVFASGAISNVPAWYLVINADRKSALTNSPIALPDGEHLNVRAWPDDPDWQRQVTDLLTRGLPILVEETGLKWPVRDEISVFEVHTPLLEGYAGVFYPGEDRIEISEDLDDLTILHEASHAWFNGGLFTGRWINEGFADLYASTVLGRLGQSGWVPDPVAADQPHAVALNAWESMGRISDEDTQARESFGYNASWTVVRSFFDEIGEEGMQRVLVAAQTRQIPYVGAASPEEVSGPAGWQRLLDLLDEVGHATKADGEFARWVVTKDQAVTLQRRTAARATYAALLKEGRDWAPPLYVRAAMANWHFDQANARIAEAHTVLVRRDELATAAGRLGLTAPLDGRTAYQTAKDSLAPVQALLEREIGAADAVDRAGRAVAAKRDAVVAIGLLGETPEVALADARTAFTQGAADTTARAQAVSALMAGAAEVGRGRLVLGIGVASLVLLIVLALVAVALLARRQLRRRRLTLAESTISYATLAAPDAQPEPVARGDAPLTEER